MQVTPDLQALGPSPPDLHSQLPASAQAPKLVSQVCLSIYPSVSRGIPHNRPLVLERRKRRLIVAPSSSIFLLRRLPD